MRKLLICMFIFCIMGGLSLAEAREKSKLTVVIETEYGKIEADLLRDEAPLTVANFIAQARTGAFDGTTFHRIIPGFVVQGGDPLSKDDDPTNDGYGGGQMPVEPRKLSNARGTISMASGSRAKPIDSQSDVQFFINQGSNAALDSFGFIPFAKVTKGMDVVDKIVQQPRDGADRPLKNITMKVKVVLSN